MRIEYLIISIIIMLVIVVAVVTFVSGNTPAVKDALKNLACSFGLEKC